MFCHNCGAELKENILFCPNCGGAVAVMQNGTSIEQETVFHANAEDNDKAVNTTDDIVTEVVDQVVVEESITIEEAKEQTDQSPAEVVPTGIISTEKIKYCPNCGVVNAENDIFCYSCGFSFTGEQTGQNGNKTTENAGKKNKKLFTVIVCILAICLIVAGVLGVAKLLFGGSKTAPVFYLSGNEMKGATSDKKIYVVGEDTYEDKDDIPNVYRLWMDIVLTKDYKYVFFPQENSSSEYDLYRMPYGKKNAEAEKVAKNVISYTVLSNNSFVYLNSDGKLYLADMKDSEKISSDVISYQISADKKQILWVTGDDNDVYVQDIKLTEEKEKIASEINYVVGYTEDFSKIIISEDDEVVLYTGLKDKTKICSEYDGLNIHVDGNDIGVYYYEYADEGVDLSTIIDDPDAESDAAMTEPVLADYQKTVTKESFWGPRESVETDDSYYDDLDKYQKKIERDQFRQYLQNQYGLGQVTVSYFSTQTMDSVDIYEGPYCDIRTYQESVLLVELDAEQMEPVSLDELMTMESEAVADELDEMLRTGVVLKIYNGEKSVNLDCDMSDYKNYIGEFYSNSSKYYLTLYDESGEDTTLLEIAADGKAVVLCEEYYTTYACSDKGILYGAELDDSEIELYLNDENIESEVYCGNITMLEDGRIVYMTDLDDDGSGTLWVYDNKPHEVNEDVITYVCNGDGRIAYLYDYSFKKYKGDLMIFSKNKSKLIDSDVRALLPYYVQD